METMTLEEILKANPKLEGRDFGRFLDEVDKLPRRKKRGFSLALPGADPTQRRVRRWRTPYGGWYGKYY